MRTLYLECNMGAAGDMLMSALYEICDDKNLFLESMNSMFAPLGVTVEAESVQKCGIGGTHMKVSVHGVTEGEEPESGEEHSHHHGTSYTAVLRRINSLAMPEQVRRDAESIYRMIGNAESVVHQTDLQQIHFHEVGTLDALADVVGCSLLMYMISPQHVMASPIHVGTGFVRTAHGILSVPAPATAEILKGIPFYTGSISGELCTPTGAAILKHFVKRFTSMPILVADAVGYGMGTKDFPVANCVRAMIGEPFQEEKDRTEPKKESGFPSDDEILSISANIDDMTGETMGLATEILMAAGALDVYTIPVQMKKNRPGILLTCLCRPEELDKFTGLFFLHTSTRGVRYQTFSRAKLESTLETRRTAYGDIRVKKSSGYGVNKEKVEFEDLKSVILKNNYEVSVEDIKKEI